MTDLDLQLDPTALNATDRFQDNFDELDKRWKENLFLQFEGKFISVTYTAAVANDKIFHGLNFIPKDILVLQENPAGTLTINWDEFDSECIDLTVTGACTLRMFVGFYQES